MKILHGYLQVHCNKQAHGPSWSYNKRFNFKIITDRYSYNQVDNFSILLDAVYENTSFLHCSSRTL